MPSSVIQRSFAGGELAPALAARADQVKYVTGLRRCRNFIVQRHGGVQNRAGFRFIRACKTDNPTVALERYVSENDGESLLVEVGVGYFRFYQNGALLTYDSTTVAAYNGATNYVIGDLVKNAGVDYYARVDNVGIAPPAAATWYPLANSIYELPSPFGSDLPYWAQSGHTVTLTHKLHPAYELIFVSLTSWVLRPISTASTLIAPVGLALVPGGVGTEKHGYVITSAEKETYEESPPSGQVVNVASATPTVGAPDALTWTPDATKAEFYVYYDPVGNGTYGYIGTAVGASFKNSGIVPDFAVTPPVARATLFGATGDYPSVSAVHQQRRFFANTVKNPDAMWGSRTGFASNFGISSPLQDDDSLTFRIAGNNNHAIRHLLGLKTLVALTGAGEWTIGQPKTPLIPNGIDADQETYVGASAVKPVIIGNAILYVQARGAVLRDLQFDFQVEALAGKDLTLFAGHLVDGYTLLDIDYAQTPHSIVWAVRSDGTLLGLTYVREQDVWGWHRHDTGASGRFEDVCVVPEATEDAVYVIVRRTIGGAFKRYIERLAPRLIVDFDLDAFFVDSGLTYDGPPVSNIAGLDHLNGQVVAVVGDGAVLFNGDPTAANAGSFTVTAGTLPAALPAGYSRIHAGLPIRYAEIETLDLDVSGSAIRDKKKRVASVTLLLEASARTFRAGPDTAHLTAYALKPHESAVDAYTGPAELNLTSAFGDAGRVFIRHTDPLPLTILGVMPNVEVGG